MAEYIDIDTPLELKVVWGQTYKPYTSTLRELLDINSIPYTAADVRPVVRGTWITRPYMMGNTQYCSLCGENYGMKHNYCPNCGAQMEES